MSTVLKKEITFACALANPKIRSSIGTYYNDLTWNAPMAENIVKYFLLPDVSENDFNAMEFKTFALNFALEPEVDRLMDECIEFVDQGKNVKVFLGNFKTFYQSRFVSTLVQQHGTDVEKLISGIERMRDINLSPIPIDRLGKLDLDTVIQEDMGDLEPIPTSFKFLREATDAKGYMRGSLAMICAPPGAGKSLFLANECVNFLKAGLKVYWLALGDMMRYDFISRLTSIASGEPFRSDVATAYTRLRIQFEAHKELFDNLRISVLPAGQVDIYTVKSFLETSVAQEDDIDVFILDYDANLLQRGDANSYKEGEVVYNAMSSIARPEGRKYRLAMIASQPKIQYWDDQVLDKNTASDSSRKQAIVDLMITIGRDQSKQKIHAGTMKAAKVRRGTEGIQTDYVVEPCGRFDENVDKEQMTMATTFDGTYKNGTVKKKHFDKDHTWESKPNN